MNNLLNTLIVSFALNSVSAAVHAQTASEEPGRKASVAIESDVLSYFISGNSGMVNVSLPSGVQVALGSGRYDVPSFLLEGDDNYEKAKWKATATSVQVLRMTDRFRGPRKNGPAVGAVVLNQNWKLRSETLGGEARFKQINAGLTGGYYLHLGKHLYLYPTVAFTWNDVYLGSASVRGTNYNVAKFAPNASLHMGWEF
jgi:hypothetical protein